MFPENIIFAMHFVKDWGDVRNIKYFTPTFAKISF